MSDRPQPGAWSRLGPGIVIAATGVGAGDLVAASVCGLRFGQALLWAAACGALLKYVLNEGVARWQLVTGETLIEALGRRVPLAVSVYLAFYLALWTPAVAAALAAACGLAAHALWPALSVTVWGTLHAIAGALLVSAGAYRHLESAMKVLTALMFAALVGCALLLAPDAGAVTSGLLLPSRPAGSGQTILSVLGGVGGSVTLLAYGAWIAEKGWRGRTWLGTARADLAVAYTLTGLFAAATMTVAAAVPAGSVTLADGTVLLLSLADVVGSVVGSWGRPLFLAGVWAAVATSLLGVWDGVPTLLAIFLRALGERRRSPGSPRVVPPAAAALPAAETADRETARSEAVPEVATAIRRASLRLGLIAAVTVTAIVLLRTGRPLALVLTYTVLGSLFMPFLAASLLWLNRRRGPLGEAGNGPLTAAVLTGAMLLFAVVGGLELLETLPRG